MSGETRVRRETGHAGLGLLDGVRKSCRRCATRARLTRAHRRRPGPVMQQPELPTYRALPRWQLRAVSRRPDPDVERTVDEDPQRVGGVASRMRSLRAGCAVPRCAASRSSTGRGAPLNKSRRASSSTRGASSSTRAPSCGRRTSTGRRAVRLPENDADRGEHRVEVVAERSRGSRRRNSLPRSHEMRVSNTPRLD